MLHSPPANGRVQQFGFRSEPQSEAEQRHAAVRLSVRVWIDRRRELAGMQFNIV